MKSVQQHSLGCAVESRGVVDLGSDHHCVPCHHDQFVGCAEDGVFDPPATVPVLSAVEPDPVSRQRVVTQNPTDPILGLSTTFEKLGAWLSHLAHYTLSPQHANVGSRTLTVAEPRSSNGSEQQ